MPVSPARRLSQAAPAAAVSAPAGESGPAELAPAAGPAPVFDLKPANITAVSTPAQFVRALRQGALDIEVVGHLDLTPLLDDIRAAPDGRLTPAEEEDRKAQLDVMAMFQVDVETRSIRGNCSDPDAAGALELPPEEAEPPLLPLRPFQCMILVPDTLLAVQRGRLWLDNVYLRLQPPARVHTSLQRTPSFVALGRNTENIRFLDYSFRNDDPEWTELHATAVTFQSHSARSMHAVRAAGIGRNTAAFFTDCIFTDWGGRASPLAINLHASASITRSLFRNMLQQAELVDVSYNGLVTIDGVVLSNSIVPPEGRIVGTSMNDYQRSPVHFTDAAGVYYAADDENYDVAVEEAPTGSRGAFNGDHVIEDALMSDCLFQYYDEEDPTPQPGCPAASVEKRAEVTARMKNTTASGALQVGDAVYYEPEEQTGYGGGTNVFGEGVPYDYLDLLNAPPGPDYAFVGAPPVAADVPETADLTGGPVGAPLPAGDYYVYDGGVVYGGYAVFPGVVYGPDGYAFAPGAPDAAAPGGTDGAFTFYSDYAQFEYGYNLPDMEERLGVLEEDAHPWFAGAQRVLPMRPPPPPSWPPLTLTPVGANASATAAELVQPLSTGAAPVPDASAAGPDEAGSDDNTVLTAGLTALLFAAFAAIAICACAALMRRRRAAPADGKAEAAAGGLLTGGAVGGVKPRDEGAQKVSKLMKQLDLFTDDDLFMGEYELLGRDRSTVGRNSFVQHARGHDDGRPYAIKFFLDPERFTTEATILAAFQPFLRGSLGPALAAAAEAAGDAAPKAAPPGAEFLPRVHRVADDRGTKAADTAGRALPPCIVMDKGLSLQEWSDSTPPDLFTALAMLSSVSKRLAGLHDAGYVHSALKPSNVILTAADKRWTVVGFSHAVRAGAQVPMQFTLAYAAPEVVQAFARGDDTFVAAAAHDAWALGVLAFELLTGAPAFQMLTEGQSVAIAQLKGEQTLPWEKQDAGSTLLRKLGMLRGPILQLLERDPAKRATARQFHTACNQAFAEGAMPAV